MIPQAETLGVLRSDDDLPGKSSIPLVESDGLFIQLAEQVERSHGNLDSVRLINDQKFSIPFV